MSLMNRLIELSVCLCTEIETVQGYPLCWCGVYPGGVPSYDYCGGCDGGRCGMGFVTVDGGGLYTSFGQNAGYRPSSCSSGLQVSVQIGVLRCMPFTNDGSLPEPNDMTETAVLLLDDMQAMRRAATCCFGGDLILLDYQPIPAQGGCVGGLWRAVLDAEA